MCRIVHDVDILRFYFSKQKYFGTINFCRMSQDIGKLRCRSAQVPLYIYKDCSVIYFENALRYKKNNLVQPTF